MENGVLGNVSWIGETEKLNVISDNVLGITDVVETTTSTITLPEGQGSEEVDNDYEYQRKIFISW